MPRPTVVPRPSRPRSRPSPILLGAVATALVSTAGPWATTAEAARRHTPCPTAGVTLLRSSSVASPRFRVYRAGAALRVCTREAGERRRIRALGAWTPTTRITAGGGRLAWTTRRSAGGAPSDTVRVVDLASGRRRLTVTRAAASPTQGAPATADTVAGLRVDELVTAWVTGSGRLVAVVAVPGSVPPPEEPPGPFHVDGTYVLRDVGAAQASALASGLVLIDDSQTDDCGGTVSRRLQIPDVPGAPGGGFTYYVAGAEPGPGC